MSHYLDISLVPRTEIEYRDYHLNDYFGWGYLYTTNFPVIEMNSIELVYFRDEEGNDQTVQEIPPNWIRLEAHSGIVRLIPNARFPASLQVDQAGNYLPEILRSQFVPNLWKITYVHGFEAGKLPVLVNHAY